VAFVGGGRQPLTYVQLVEQISHVVAGLRRTGFQQGERVGVVLPDGPDLAVALIGISAAATVVPLSPATQDDELGRQLESLGCRSVVVAESDLERTARLSARGIDVLALARFGGAAGPFTLRTGGVASQTPAMIGAEPRWADVDDVALALHTSGTVGEPKLVLLTHANLSAAAAAIAEALELTARDRTLSVMPLFHIHGLSAVTATLMTGGSIACPGADGVMRLTEWLDHFRPTWLTASPTIHRELLTQARQQPDTIRHHALRFIRSASAPMPQSLIAQLEQLFAVPFIEAYGMTEASPQIASNRLAPHLRRTGSVGRAAGPEVAIVDEHGTPLQVGLEGEVVIRGNNVVTRYDGGDEANRDAFVNGWLRTGDLGRVDDDGFLFITGRIKDVINRGGEKISPLEIDRALLRHPAVRDALAYSVPHPTLGEDVAAAVVLESQLSRDDEDKVIGDIQQTLRGCLADFKIPQRIVVLDAIPGGTSGKVRRAALAAQVASGNASRDRTEGSPATGALEQRVAAIWAEVLGITPPFRDDNFFELGGDSLSAARVVARVARDMSLDAPGRILFEHPTPARMTAWLSSASHFTDIQGRPQIPSRVIRARKPEVPIPVSFQQYRLWVLDQLEPGNPAYNMHAAVDLEGLLDHAALDSALSEIVRRHQTLRTRFTVVAGQPTQVIAPPQKVRVPVVDLSALAAPERDAEAERLAAEEVRRPFHLRYGPLFRSALLRLAPTHHRLVLCVHHMVSDGWSMRIMLDELRTLYDAHRHGRSTPLAEPLLHYADFAAWQRDPSRQGEIDEDLRYWVSTFQKAPAPLRLPSDRARPSTPSGAGAVHRVRIDALTWQPLAALGRRLGATPFMTMMAAFQVLLSELSGQIDFAVGTPFAGRPDVGSEGLVGFFADTIAIRADLSGRPDFITALARVRRAALDASAHQRLPFDRLVDALTPERDLGVNPIFQVMFAFQNVPGHQGPTHWSSDLAATPAVIAPAHAKFDLTLYLDPDGDSLNATWLFARDLFELSTIERMSARFLALVGELANRPTEPLEIRSASSLPPAPEEHAAESLSEPTDIVTLVERHVQQTPHRVALACGPEQLTWTELNRLANGLARRLREAGVEPGATVGVCLDRSVDSIVAVLGVWKAGATYLPIDPAHPPAHIASVFGDARPFALVADRPIAGAGSLSTLAPRDVYEGGNTGDRDADPPRAVGLDALAYVIYTSGSTGRPKGVAVTHRNLAHYVRSLPSALGVGADDCWLHTASFAFSSSIRQIAVPLVTGARLEIATKAAIADPGELFGVIARAGVTVIDLVPSYARACQRVLASLSDAARGERLENRLRLILSASEPLTPAIVRSWRELLGSWVELVNMFGQTETTGVVTLHRIGEADERSIASQIPVGRPFGETHAFVLGEDGGTAPPGVEGELHLAGPQVCCGYLNDRALTDARFLIDPTRPSQRIYRTGDLARCDADGTITLGGRIDRQVKVRGQRVEPEQVEAAIVRHPGWTEAAVVTEQDPAGFTRLTAVCTPAPGHDGDVAALRTWLARELPAILVPDRVIAAPALPRTPSGKVDRPALAGALVVAPTISSRRVDNTSPAVEGVITGIWKSLLQVERIGPNDNFFDLGGNSILALEMIARAHEAGLVIVPRQLWENQTIAELARVTVSSTARPQRPQSPPRNDPQPSRPTTSTTRPAVLVTVESLRAYGREALEGAGLRRDGAAIVTEAQLEASLRDQPTHNMVSIPRYARRLAAGTINPQPNIRIERETATSAHVDGDNGPGQWVADVAMQTAIGLARNSGVGIVGVRRSNHLGAAGHYPWMAAREGLIGICTTNGPVILAPTGGVTPTFGNNPIGVGIPAGQHFPIVLDVAMSVATRGKIGLELAEGRPLLEGWILDRLGRSSTDPADLVAGLGVPIGGHKGYGLALVMEVLAGVLTGANFGWANRRERALREARPAGFGHFFLAIDPELFMPAAEFTSRVDQLISEAKSSERAVGADEILIPGERELRARARSLREGVRLRASTYDSLVKYGKAAGLRTDLAVRDVADAPEPKTVTAR
jgi:amino acid adenylation domain-containing protein